MNNHNPVDNFTFAYNNPNYEELKVNESQIEKQNAF